MSERLETSIALLNKCWTLEYFTVLIRQLDIVDCVDQTT